MRFGDYWQENRHNISALLFDIDGTVMLGGKILPGVNELFDRLRAENVPCFLLTNDGNNSLEEKSVKLRRGGLHCEADEIISCASVLETLAEENGWRGKKFFLAGVLGDPCFGAKAGLEIITDPERIGECCGVIQSEGYYNWHDSLQAVLNFLLKNPDAPYIVPNPDAYWPAGRGLIGVGAGGQARFIEMLMRDAGVCKKPLYLGKPEQAVYDYALRRLEKKFPCNAPLKREKVVAVGDSLKSDVAGANDCGMVSALVLTGITSLPLPEDLDERERPDLIFESM